MTWFAALPEFAVSVLLLFAIGAPIAWAVGARGIGFLAVAVTGSVSSVTAAALLGPIVHVTWMIGLPISVSVVVAVIAWIVRRLIRTAQVPPPREWGRTFGWGMVGVAIGAAVIGFSVVSSLPSPSNPPQSYDGIFHLNAVRFVLDTGDASPLHMTMTVPARSMSFYPTIWHAFVSLVVQLTGTSITVATTTFALAVCAALWPVAVVFFVRTLFGRGYVALVAAGVAASSFATFPLQLLWYGTLFPNLFACALLPIALGLLVLALTKRRLFPPLICWLLLLWAVFGMSLAHPNALFSFFALSAPLIVFSGIDVLRRGRGRPHAARRIVVVVAALVVVFAVEGVLWNKVGTTDNAWKPSRTFLHAIIGALVNGLGGLSAGIAITVLVLLGAVVTLVVRRHIWLVFSYGICVLLFAVAAGGPDGPIRTAITGLWNNDVFRLAALLPMAAAPLAVVGMVFIVRCLGRLLARIQRPRRSMVTGGLTVTIMTVVVVLTIGVAQQGPLAQTRASLHATYSVGANSPVLSPDEISMFRVIEKQTSANAVIAGNPWNGSALAYAYTGRSVLFPHVGGRYPQSYMEVAKGLAQGTPAACSAAEQLHVGYVLDFGTRYVFTHEPRANAYPGLTAVQHSPVLTLLAQRGAAKLYKVTGCQ